MGLPSGSMGKESTCSAGNTGDAGSIPGLGRSPGEGNGNTLQYSCLENPMDKGAYRSIAWLVKKSQTRLNDYIHTHTHTHTQITSEKNQRISQQRGGGNYRKKLGAQTSRELCSSGPSKAFQMSTSSSNHPKEPRGTAQPGDSLRTKLHFTLAPCPDSSGHQADPPGQFLWSGGQFCFHFRYQDPIQLIHSIHLCMPFCARYREYGGRPSSRASCSRAGEGVKH